MMDRTASMAILFIAFTAVWVPTAFADVAPPPEDEYYIAQPPGPAENCLYNPVNGLSYECAKQVYFSIDKKKVDVTDACCRRVMSIGKTCWSIILSIHADDPCHFFRFVTDHCKKVVGIESDGDDDIPTSDCTKY